MTKNVKPLRALSARQLAAVNGGHLEAPPATGKTLTAALLGK